MIQDVPTRWNSSYYMLERLLENKRAVFVYHSEASNFNYVLTKQQWDLLENVLALLKPFEEATKYVSMSQNLISEVIATVSCLKTFLNSQALFGVGTFKESLINNLENRFSDKFSNKNFSVATFLDPRYRNFITEKERTSVIEQLATLHEHIVSQSDHSSAEVNEAGSSGIVAFTSSRSTATASATTVTDTLEVSSSDEDNDNLPLAMICESRVTKKSTSLWDCFAELAEVKTHEDCGNSDFDLEIELYMKSQPLKREKCPLQWWKIRETTMPNLARLAKKFLGAPASSVASERLISKAGNIYEAKRNRLTAENGEILTFLHNNLRKLNFEY